MNKGVDQAISTLEAQKVDLQKTINSTNAADVNTKIAEINDRIIDAESKK